MRFLSHTGLTHLELCVGREREELAGMAVINAVWQKCARVASSVSASAGPQGRMQVFGCGIGTGCSGGEIWLGVSQCLVAVLKMEDMACVCESCVN